MPHAASMFADFGAEVIHIERPNYGDTYRTLAPFVKDGDKKVSSSWAQDARNRLSMAVELNMSIPESRDIFLGLTENVDIWFENLVWLDKYGISDEMCQQVNSRLVIVQVSGLGRPQFGGVPEVCERPSYDMIGQCADGWTNLVGFPEPDPPSLIRPWSSDYYSALTAAFAAMTALWNVRQTGEGQVIDVAQFEANARVLSDTFVTYLSARMNRQRTGNKSSAFQPYDIFQAKDRWVVVGAFGPAVYERFVKAIGLDSAYYTWQECSSSIEAVSSEKGQERDRITREWIGERTAKEFEEHMARFKVACTIVVSAKDADESEHWHARGDFAEYEDQTLGCNVKALGIIPKFSKTPAQIWRGAPALGQDTDRVLTTILGYSSSEVAQMREKGVIG